MKTIGIIGAGFSGMMTAVQVIKKAAGPMKIIIIEKEPVIGRGTAYNPYSEKQLLNVSTKKMSAFPDDSDHFLNWVMQQKDFRQQDRSLIANSYLPRGLYGMYLHEIWESSQAMASKKQITLTIIHSNAEDLIINNATVLLTLHNNTQLEVDTCVIATGNHTPRNPQIKNLQFYNSPNYYQNPWKIESVQNVREGLPVLIIGNGLTMVDTVFGLFENGFKGSIYAISPNGFNILPHRHNGLQYSKLTEELKEGISLYELVKLVNKHIKLVREFGVSAEPVINSLRPYTQSIWQSLSTNEKVKFMSRLRHLWGVARHRIPLHSHDKVQQLRIDRQLHIYSGKILDFQEDDNAISVVYFDKKAKRNKSTQISRVINCTGPETNLMNLNGSFLKKCLLNGIISQDSLKLGIRANTETFQVIDSQGKLQPNLLTLGSNLKGELWESTAINELREQADKIAGILTLSIKNHA